MLFRQKTTTLFWILLFLIVLLQLSASREFSFAAAFVFASCLMLTLWGYFRIISISRMRRFLAGLRTVWLFALKGLSSALLALILAAEGYLVVRLMLEAPTAQTIFDDRVSVFFGLFSFSLLISALGHAFERYRDYLEREKEIEVLKRKSLEMEISLLRNQLSPHFTFNVLNNLQFLIRKDTGQALELLARYSRILRYYVYESQKKQIGLEQEAAFLKEYFDLEIHRHASDLQISCQWDIAPTDCRIVPFILSAFVENAFKHVLPNQADQYFIRHRCGLMGKTLTFEIANTCQTSRDAASIRHRSGQTGLPSEGAGVGLRHVRERLNLSYPGSYQLTVREDEEVFSVWLQINLDTGE